MLLIAENISAVDPLDKEKRSEQNAQSFDEI